MTWWQMMQIVWWGSLGWALCIGAVVIAWAIIAELFSARDKARFKAFQDERERDNEPTNGRDHGNN